MAYHTNKISIVFALIIIILFLSNRSNSQFAVFVQETPISQQCEVTDDCPIVPKCESEKVLITCNSATKLCDYSSTSAQCRNQILTYQEISKNVESTETTSSLSGINSFNCFFEGNKNNCQVGEKVISISSPSYICGMPSDSSTIVSTGRQSDECWKSTLSFDGKEFELRNNEEVNDIGFGIKAKISISASLDSERRLKDNWGILAKITLPDNFLEIVPKSSGNKFILKDSTEKVIFVIRNTLFGINGGYTILTQNMALEGGVVLRDDIKEVYLPKGDTEIIYNFRTDQLGNIKDTIGIFGKVTTDKDYFLKPVQNGIQKFLVISKEVRTELSNTLVNDPVKPNIIEEDMLDEGRMFGMSNMAIIVLSILGLLLLFLIIKR